MALVGALSVQLWRIFSCRVGPQSPETALRDRQQRARSGQSDISRKLVVRLEVVYVNRGDSRLMKYPGQALMADTRIRL